MPLKATITNRGAIILGKYIACDAFDETKPLRIVTHAHADHTIGLQQSLRTCKKTLMTKTTKDLIDVIKGPLFLMGGYVETLDYNKTFQLEEERITFFPAEHILGAAQVFVEDAEGTRIIYTGDFKIDGTLVVDTDILVIEATYGSPTCKRSFDKDVKDLLVSLVEEGLRKGTVYVFSYHGKLQEIMQLLRERNVDSPFVAPERVFQVSRVCELHGMRVGRLLLSEDREAKELIERNASCVAFYHMNARKKFDQGLFRLYVSGWEFNSPCREIADKEYVVALSDHSDFDGLMEYVRRSKPKLVITDNFRVGHAETLARLIHKRFGFSAVALPRR